MEKYSLIKFLIPIIEEYENEYKNTDIKEFSVFLKNKVWDYDISKNDSEDEKNLKNYKAYPEVEFSSILTTLYRFTKLYLKQTFKPRKFKTIDEFGFLAKIYKEGNILKNKLISSHLMEISSGSEIIKRLIKNDLVIEYPDLKDKRAKRVELTELGKAEILNAFDDMFKVSKLLKGNLNPEEFKATLEVFNKLNYFHWHINEKEKNNNIDELLEKYVEKLKK